MSIELGDHRYCHLWMHVARRVGPLILLLEGLLEVVSPLQKYASHRTPFKKWVGPRESGRPVGVLLDGTADDESSENALFLAACALEATGSDWTSNHNSLQADQVAFSIGDRPTMLATLSTHGVPNTAWEYVI